ncbi:MlaA family lipoprotein [Marinimicrobium locisalis]|uniref:MlaA family lipoprotein n=1 Tax=Marinimicrobium locisalis TaxID=546022 RepID=UPI003221CFAD
MLLALLSMVMVPAHADEFEDPWEDFNRKVHGFNMTVDRFFLKPVTKAYRFVAPEVVELGVNNAFQNLSEVPSALNGVLQGKPGSALRDSGRFLVNSTVGIAGLFDVASRLGLPSDGQEDFGQTLGLWGFDRGPYVVLPFFGSSTVRDTVGLPVQSLMSPIYHIDHTPTQNSTLAMYYINRRSQLMDLEEQLTGDHYTFIRDAYLQRREYLIKDGEVEDSFGSDMDMSEYGDFDEEEGDPF